MTTNELRVSMYRAMRELLGPGYVPDYYEQSAVDFIAIADQAISDEREACAKVAKAEKVDADDTGAESDDAYNRACDDIADAIRARDGVAKKGTA